MRPLKINITPIIWKTKRRLHSRNWSRNRNAECNFLITSTQKCSSFLPSSKTTMCQISSFEPKFQRLSQTYRFSPELHTWNMNIIFNTNRIYYLSVVSQNRKLRQNCVCVLCFHQCVHSLITSGRWCHSCWHHWTLVKTHCVNETFRELIWHIN